MEGMNQTVTKFTFLGLTNDFNLQVLIFIIFTLVYIFTILGNIGVTALILVDPQLHKPMYFFLSNLSCVDLLCSTSICPKMLAVIISDMKTISIAGCAFQLFFFTLCVGCDFCLLGSMAFDRYVAICKPLHYQLTMNQMVCACLVCAAYAASFLNAVTETYVTFTLSFCGSNVIDHFYCDLIPLVKLSCSDTSTNQMVMLGSVSIFVIGSFIFIMTSYCFIIFTILRIPSMKGKQKAFSTCASHFTVIALYYGTIFAMYIQPLSNSVTQKKALSLFYTLVIPMLNPMIYSIKSEQVKKSFQTKYHQMCMKMGIQ